MAEKITKKTEFGDFQTPRDLANLVVAHLQKSDPHFHPNTIIEPSCGVGAFVFAAGHAFPNVQKVLCGDVNSNYLKAMQREACGTHFAKKITAIDGSFFEVDWRERVSQVPRPILVIGNPPWVTKADIARFKGSNAPIKSNQEKYAGIEAITGKSNFDISEWMLMEQLQWIADGAGCLAVLVKTSVARKVLRKMWQSDMPVSSCQIVQIDALKSFDASVDACLLTVHFGQQTGSKTCDVYEALRSAQSSVQLGYRRGFMVSDASAFDDVRDLLGADPHYVWRSGVKHDCSKVMELKASDGRLYNGLGADVDIEPTYRFPLLKSSDLGNKRISVARREVIVTQKSTGDSTDEIQTYAPLCWQYLNEHAKMLDQRKSLIYKNRPRFSVFGIGPYAFSPWKVAISALYKRLDFQVVGPIEGRPVMFDDTVNFIGCTSREEAAFLCNLLNSSHAQKLFNAMIFWKDKRPITIEILKRISLEKLAHKLDQREIYYSFLSQHHETARRTKPSAAEVAPD